MNHFYNRIKPFFKFLRSCFLIFFLPVFSFGQMKYLKLPDCSYRNDKNGEVIMQELNCKSMEKMGYPSSTLPHNTRSEERTKQIVEYTKQQQGYHNPNSTNHYKQSRLTTAEQIAQDLKQDSYLSSQLAARKYYQSTSYHNDFKNYQVTKKIIEEMLTGERTLSVKDAFYLIENAYGGLHLSIEEYHSTIDQNVQFIKQWLKEHHYNLQDKEALHFGIQKFMTDTLYLTHQYNDGIHKNTSTVGHIPYYYDYIDYAAKKDKRNYFVTKTLATGTGQCHTLPIMYLILAEALDVEAYLSYNPQHSFIRYQNNEGTVLNYETTIGHFITNQSYLEILPMMAKANQNDLFVNNLNKKQVVASTLIDLASNYIREHWVGDQAFLKSCLESASKYFPNQTYINTSSHYVRRKLYSKQLNSIVKKHHITSLVQLKQHPEAFAIYLEYRQYMAQVEQEGYQDFPEEEYIRMMSYHDKQGRLQQSKGVPTKTNQNLFIK